MTAEDQLAIEDDLRILTEQERLLQFTAFSHEDAWTLGSALRQTLLQQGAGCSVEIEVAGQILFRTVTAGANPGQANWIRRKRNTVHHFGCSTYAVGRKLQRDETTLWAKHALGERNFAAHGGGFPLALRGTEMIGSVVLSGLAQREDHNIVVEGLAQLLLTDVPRLST